MNVSRRGARMITTKVRKGVYTVVFHGEAYIIIKRHFWYSKVIQVDRSFRYTHVSTRSTEDKRWDDDRRRYVKTMEGRWPSLKAFQAALKERSAAEAMESLIQ